MFEVLFIQSALDDLRFLRKNDQNAVLDAIDQQLVSEPLAQTRNRNHFVPMILLPGRCASVPIGFSMM